jgi:hypothetical protein
VGFAPRRIEGVLSARLRGSLATLQTAVPAKSRPFPGAPLFGHRSPVNIDAVIRKIVTLDLLTKRSQSSRLVAFGLSRGGSFGV